MTRHLFLALFGASCALASQTLPREQTFTVGDHTAFLLEAIQPAPQKPWVWYAPTFKSGLMATSGNKVWYYERLLNAGISIAGCDLGEVRGSPASTEKFAAQKVPLFSVHGDSDVVVPLDLNSALLKQRYESLGGQMALKVIPGEGHKVGPSFFECRELVDFVLETALRPH